jgi:hypothetical protein
MGPVESVLLFQRGVVIVKISQFGVCMVTVVKVGTNVENSACTSTR